MRRMLDAAIDTRNIDIFEKAISFCNKSEEAEAHIENEALDLIAAIEKAGVSTTQKLAGPLVAASKISKRYSKGNFKLNEVDVDLRHGEITGLVGENGNGKTTLLRILVGELKTDSGEIKYALNRPVQNQYDLKTSLAFIPQRIPRWWGTLTDNLQFVAAQYGYLGRENYLWVEMVIARLGLRPYKNLSWNTISSGYRTRFEIARTLLRKPEVLLLDEPLANLDIISQQTILQDLRYLALSEAHPMAVVLSSQQIYEVEKVSDKIIFLKQGSPVYQNLKENSSVEEQLLFEIETTADREQLLSVFRTLSLQDLCFNGGVYLAAFAAGTPATHVVKALAESGTEISYFRNISKSSRRFFTK